MMLETTPDSDIQPINPDTVCIYGETKVYFEPHVFAWKIQDFLQVFQSVNSNLVSPTFEGSRNTKWQLRLQGQTEGSELFIKTHLYLLEMKPDSKFKETGIPVRFCISLLNRNGDIVRGPVGGYLTCVFKELSGWSIEKFLKVESLRQPNNNLLSDGNLIVRCLIRSDYKVLHKSCGMEQTRFTKPLRSPAEELSANFLNLFNNPVLSDLVIEVGHSHTAFPVHKSVLIARSPVFKEMFCNKISTESTIFISYYDDDVVKTMLEYIYCGEPINKKIILSKPAQVLRIGNEYQLPDFLILCESFITDHMTVRNALDVLIAAESNNRQELMNKAIFMINWSRSKINPAEFKRVAKVAPQVFKHLYLAPSE